MFFQKSIIILIFIGISIWCGFLSFGAYLNSSPTNDLFPFHPPFMAFGFLFCLTCGILSFVNKNKSSFHVFFQILGTVCITIGFAIVVSAKNNVGEEHFKSTHAVIGLISVICSWIQLFSGVLKYNKSSHNILKNHGGFGILTYILGISALLIASSTYLCGNILLENKSNICVDEDYISMQYSVSMIVLSSLTVMLYINKPSKKISILNEPLKDYQTIYS